MKANFYTFLIFGHILKPNIKVLKESGDLRQSASHNEGKGLIVFLYWYEFFFCMLFHCAKTNMKKRICWVFNPFRSVQVS